MVILKQGYQKEMGRSPITLMGIELSSMQACARQQLALTHSFSLLCHAYSGTLIVVQLIVKCIHGVLQDDMYSRKALPHVSKTLHWCRWM